MERDEKRNSFTNLSSTEIEKLEFQLSEESKKESILLKKMTKYWNFQIENAQKEVNLLLEEIYQLKEERRVKSGVLQQKLFAEYSFLNQFGERKRIG